MPIKIFITRTNQNALTVNKFLELIFIYLKKHETESVYKMSYFDSENEYDPWAPVNSAPAYSFGTQPAAPQPSFAAQQPDFSAQQPAFAPQPDVPQQDFSAQPDLSAQQPVFAGQHEAPQQASPAPPPPFAAPRPPFTAPQADFAAPQPTQGKV